jgi:hypothetical protein
MHAPVLLSVGAVYSQGTVGLTISYAVRRWQVDGSVPVEGRSRLPVLPAGAAAGTCARWHPEPLSAFSTRVSRRLAWLQVPGARK